MRRLCPVRAAVRRLPFPRVDRRAPGGYSGPDHDDPRYLASIGVCLECGSGMSSPYDECTCYEDDGGPEDPEPAYAEAQ